MRPRTLLLVLATLIAGAFLLLAVGCEEETADIAKYPQAEEVKTGSRGIFPIALSGDKPLEADKYRSNMRYRTFETNDSADQVLDFYKDEFAGWKTELSIDTGETGAKTLVAVWSKDDRKSVAWLAASEAGGVTQVVAMTGTR